MNFEQKNESAQTVKGPENFPSPDVAPTFEGHESFDRGYALESEQYNHAKEYDAEAAWDYMNNAIKQEAINRGMRADSDVAMEFYGRKRVVWEVRNNERPAK